MNLYKDKTTTNSRSPQTDDEITERIQLRDLPKVSTNTTEIKDQENVAPKEEI